MKALVVGLGSVGRRHARNWAALGLGEVWVCRQHGAAQPEPLGIEARMFSDLDQALAAGPDVVLVTNPTSLHVETARRAIEAGAHVLVEKPLGASLEGVADLIQAAQRAGRVLAVGYTLRFHPGLARVRELLLDGAIGRPVSARAEFGEYLPDWHPWEDYRHSYSARRALGGGVVLTQSHELDALCWLLGPPTCVFGFAERTGLLEVDTEDVAEIVLRFGDGCLASLHVDEVRRPPQRWLELTGEAGILRWEYDQNRVLQYAPTAQAWRVEEGDPAFVRNDMFLAELRQLAAAARGEPRQPLADGRQAAAVLAVGLAALRASTEGRAIDLAAEGPPVAEWLSTP
jgi:predicted dehydrogenase